MALASARQNQRQQPAGKLTPSASIPASTATESPPRRWLDRLSVYGDFWLRYLDLGVRACPWFIEPLIVAVYTCFFYLVAAPARRALLANMRVLFPRDAPPLLHGRALRVIWNFAWSLVDAAHVRGGRDLLDWEVAGLEHLRRLSRADNGALILTAHMGSYDLAAPLFGRSLGRRLHMVRTPERHPDSQEYASRQRDHQDSEHCVIHYNEPGNMLAVKLAGLLRDHEIVAIQGDRILFEVAGMRLPFSTDHDWELPKGPFLLGLVSRCPLLPLFITRRSWRRYRITALPPYEWPAGRLDKEAQWQAAGEWWSHHLAAFVREHWEQWFVFESAFTPSQSRP